MSGLIGLLLLAATSTRAAAQQPAAVPTGPVIVVVGESVVRRAPDVSLLDLVVESRARSPRDAQMQNAATMTAVRARLTAAAVPASALRTSGVALHPEFDNANGRQTLRGYVARNSLEVRIEDVGRIGEIADAAVQAGATSIGGIRFDLKDRAGAEQEAIRLAVADARGRANAAAAGAGRTVDAIIRIEDRRVDGGVPRPVAFMRAAGQAAAVETTPIEPGEIEIRSQVEVTVSMR